MLTISYTDEVRRSPDFPLVERQAGLLDDITRSRYFDDPVTVEWESARELPGRPVYRFRMTDGTGTASNTITVEELGSPDRAELRFLVTWGRVLAARSERHLAAAMSRED